MSNYPPGAANDPNAPYNEPLTKYAKVRAEVTVDIGTMIDVFVEVDEDGYPDMEDLRAAVIEVLCNKFINNSGDVLSDIHIWDWRFNDISR
jgi:hypothetical protein